MTSPSEKTALSSVVATKSKLREYPFSSRQFDATTTDGEHLQQLLEDEIVFTASSRFHYLRTQDDELYKEVALGMDIDVEEWRTSRYHPEDAFDIELYLISHPSHSTLAISRSTLISLLEAAAVPPTFVEVLSDNNGLFIAAQTFKEEHETPFSLDIQVKIPLGPYINGSFYYRYSILTKSTTAFIFFNERLIKRLEWVLDPQQGKGKDPFLILSTLITESCYTIEASRSFLDQEVQLRESLTGATMVAMVPRNIAPIEQYPPLFDKLHTTQQQLMYLESTLQFQVRLIRFLKKQHTILTRLRSEVAESDRSRIKVQAQKVANSLDFSFSQMEGMLLQVQTLSLRIRIQLGIVESRLNQSNSRTQVIIAEETKRDSMAMKTIAALTMLFLPGTFTASFFSMPFFNADPGSNGGFSVNHFWWLYVAVTIPLTALIVLAWLGWLRYLDLPLVGMSTRTTKK